MNIHCELYRAFLGVRNVLEKALSMTIYEEDIDAESTARGIMYIYDNG